MSDPAAPPAPAPARRDRLALLGLVALLVALRSLLVLRLGDVFGYGEELVRGSVARAVTGGLDLPLADLFYHHYEGGGFVHALLTIPAFALFGPSLLAHKVVALAVEPLVLWAGWSLARRAFGRPAGLVFGLLWVLAPLAYQLLAPLNLGIHYQALGFQFALAAQLLAIVAAAERGTAPRVRVALAGLTGGFGLFYDYQLAPLIGLGALLLLARRSLGPGGWATLVGAFLVGAAPLLAMLAAVGDGVLDIHGSRLGSSSEGTTVFSLPYTLWRVLGPRGALQLLLLAGLPVAAWLVGRRGGPTPGVAPGEHEHDGLGPRAFRWLGLYLLVYVLLVPLSGFARVAFGSHFDAMRYAPLYGFALLLTAGALGTWVRAGGPLAAGGRVLLTGLLTLGVWSTAAALETGRAPSLTDGWRTLTSRRGTDFDDYLAQVVERTGVGPVESLRLFAAIDGVPREELLPAAADAVLHDAKLPLCDLLAILRAADPEGWRDWLPGLGSFLMEDKQGALQDGRWIVRHRVPECADLEDPAGVEADLLGALGRFATGYHPTLDNLRAELDQMRAWGMQPEVYRGFGHRCFEALGLRPGATSALLEGRGAGARREVLAGWREALAERSLPGRALPDWCLAEVEAPGPEVPSGP